ncbi:hypothetical protein N0V93_004274 [Gnomoniopsis smithogilvyi]|uniref:Inositolphosphorylceramide synthase subunit Kei1-domain-containing protein n=1 Tax=Gnomoniopsis smithogilvyi TaxID=1191159 RepID=A0A9W8YSA3_9PEZI|nr:hypothetical protein N0V93_004274 [Gnomoniopsis smithogilvyi]
MANSRGSWLRLPKPKTFLGLMSLQTGAEIITVALLINKATGLYGLLAILTGYTLDAVQLSMYIYSVAVLVTLAFLLPHIRKHTPFQNLLLSWVYIIDTALNTAYTAYFALEWFMASEGNPAGDAVEQATDTAASMVLITVFTLVRLYLMMVVMSFTRQVMLAYVASLEGDKGMTARPFATSMSEGKGWRGNLARAMVFVGEEYWIGGRDDDGWAAGDEARVPLAADAGDDM